MHKPIDIIVDLFLVFIRAKDQAETASSFLCLAKQTLLFMGTFTNYVCKNQKTFLRRRHEPVIVVIVVLT